MATATPTATAPDRPARRDGHPRPRRPAADRDAARTRAALLTPLTVPADTLFITGVVALSVVALPVFLVEVWTGTAPRC